MEQGGGPLASLLLADRFVERKADVSCLVKILICLFFSLSEVSANAMFGTIDRALPSTSCALLSCKIPVGSSLRATVVRAYIRTASGVGRGSLSAR